MKRRKAIKQIGLGLSAGLVVPSWLSSCKREDPEPEVKFDGVVAIIGAGAAGLYAADILNARGVSVMVFEAGNQMGGRIRSLRNQQNLEFESISDFPVELGADVVYGNDSALGKIIQNYRLNKIVLGTDDTDQFILDNEARAASEWGGDSDFNTVRNFVSGLPTYAGGDVSMLQASGATARGNALLNSLAGNFYGSTGDKVSAKGIADNLQLIEHDNEAFLIRTNPLQDLVISRFSQILSKVQLNKAIKTINYSGAKIMLTDQEGTQTEVDKVIVTSSLAVLKSGGISFSPGLPSSKTSAFSKFGMDHSLRIIIDFKKNFWGENTGYIWGGTNGPSYFNAGVNRSEFYRTLYVTVHGAKAAELSALGDNMIDPILAELDAVYNGQASLFIRKVLNNDGTEGNRIWFKADWGNEPYIKGGYSYPLVGATLDDRMAVAAPVGTKLFFAGEATDIKGDAGTINGALNSAERVVEEVVTSIISA